ncbi:MAG: hypothetical protein KGP29_06770 [Proteobacteria bacterium]|nr:hypothetical protein [Pseudomonadota bacterium]
MFKASHLIKKFLYFSLILALPIFFQSCSGGRVDPFDISTGATREEAFSTLLKNGSSSLRKSEKEDPSKAPKEIPVPKMSKLIVSPPPPVIGSDKIISFSVTDQIPLKDVLIEFGRVVQIDVDVDPKISGNIILSAKNRPLKEVIDRIATLGRLRYSYKNGVLHFEQDSVYAKNYFVDYLLGGSLWTDVEANIPAVLAAEMSEGSSGGDLTNPTTNTGAASFTSNKSAGIITVVGTDRQHKAVSKYLEDVQKYASAQVLIEAKVVEVTLTKDYSSGIDWSSAGGGFSATNGYAAGGALDIVLAGTEITASISALEKFGETKTISSPRISAINNQKATLNFTDKLVYFQVQQTQSNTSTTGGTTALVTSTITSTKLEESVGVILEIVPSINLKTNEIVMSIKPKLSVLSDYVVDPASPADLLDADKNRVVNQVPVIQTRELDTSAKIQSGNIIVIGGLMKDISSNTDSGIPFLNRIPVLGWLFKSMSRSSGITETVIFIKATIINSGTPVKKIDRDIQKAFDPSKREYF